MKKGGRSALYVNSGIAPSGSRGDAIRARRTSQTQGTPRGTILGTRHMPKHNGERKAGG